jgi:hypothetical protein
MELAEARGIKGMNSNKGQCKIFEGRVYHLENRFSTTGKLLRFKAVTKNIVQNTLMTLDGISAEEIQREKRSPSRLERYSLLHDYLDYLERHCEGEA